MPRAMIPVFDRMKNYEAVGTCWEWRGQKDTRGYGVLEMPGTNRRGGGKRVVLRAHRLSYLMRNGSMPTDLMVLHRCDNPPCINPDHLFLGTAKENSNDMYAKGRQNNAKGNEIPRAKLTPGDVLEIRRLRAGGFGIRELGRKFGLTHAGIAAVVNRKTWRHI